MCFWQSWLLVEVSGVEWASGYLCHVIEEMMRNALFPRHFTLARAFSLSRTIRSIWGTIQIIERSTLEALIGRYFHLCINKFHEVGGGTAPPVTLLLFYSRCHRLWSVTGCFISDYFFYFYFFYFFISTTSIDILCSSTYSKIKSQKSHTRYLISSQGILHFTKQLKNVEMFRVCN